MERYLSVVQVAELTGYAQQTIYNKIHKKEFVLGRDYLKLSRRKILFREEAIREWLSRGGHGQEEEPVRHYRALSGKAEAEPRAAGMSEDQGRQAQRLVTNRIRI